MLEEKVLELGKTKTTETPYNVNFITSCRGTLTFRLNLSELQKHAVSSFPNTLKLADAHACRL